MQIHYAVNPTLTIVDGILSLEGDGPGKGGRPRRTDVLIGSRDAAAVDAQDPARPPQRMSRSIRARFFKGFYQVPCAPETGCRYPLLPPVRGVLGLLPGGRRV